VTVRSVFRALLLEIRDSVFPILDSFFLYGRQEGKGGVAVVRLDAIGDFILWLPFAQVYRQLYPDQKIVLFANEAWADFARSFAFWDDVVSVRVDDLVYSPLYRWRMLYNISKYGFSVAIHPTCSRVLLKGDSLVRATKAHERIGSAGDQSNISARHKAVSDSWYTRLVPMNLRLIAELERNAEFFRGLGGERQHLLPMGDVPGGEVHVSVPAGAYVVLFPGASWEGRRWPVSRFAELAQWLFRSFGLWVVICGSENERHLAEMLVGGAGVPNISNFAGKTTLAEFAMLIQRATLLIGNETSAIHLASAVGTPSICLLGGGHFGRFVPYPKDWSGCQPRPVYFVMDCYGCNWRCTKPRAPGGCVPCIDAISLDAVKREVSRLMHELPRVS